MFAQNLHHQVPFNVDHWWQIVENFATNQGNEWKLERPENQLEYVQNLANDLMTLKQRIEKRQNLARLYFVPCFLNHALDFDVHWPDEDHYRRDAFLVYKRYPMLLFATQSIQCDEKAITDRVQRLVLSIIAQSAVREWPVEMSKKDAKFFWDRQRLFFCKKDLASKSSVTYQIRFLALVHSKEFSYKPYVNKAVAYHFLEELGKETQHVTGRGKKEKNEPSPGCILYKDKENTKAPTAKIRRTVSRNDNEEVSMNHQKIGGAQAVVITCTPDKMAETSKLWRNMGGERTYDHFTIKLNTAGYTSEKGAGTVKYRIYTEIVLQTRFGVVHLGENETVNAHLRCPGLTSLPFELTTNPSTHEESHFFPFTWRIINDYHNDKNHRGDSIDTLALSWTQLTPWFAGMIAAQSDHYCRKLDDSEMRSFRRMVLMNRVMKAAGQDSQVDQTTRWNEAVKQRLRDLEFQMFGVQLTGKAEEFSLQSYLHGISKILRQATLVDTFLITEDDLNQCCWYVDRTISNFTGTSFTPIKWLLNAAEIICDESESLHKKPTPAADKQERSKAPFSITMFNDGYISLRPCDSASTITKVVTDKMKEYRPSTGNMAPMPTIFLRIDESELKTLCIEYSGLYENDEHNVTEPKFGRITLGALKAKKFYPKDLTRRVVKARKDNAIFGLKAFFLGGYPSKFKKIMKVKQENNVTGMKVHIFPVGRADVTSLYDHKEEVDGKEDNEVDPLIGPEQTFMDVMNDLVEGVSRISSTATRALRDRQYQLLQAYRAHPFMGIAMSPEIQMPLSMDTMQRGSPGVNQIQQINVQQNLHFDNAEAETSRFSNVAQPGTCDDLQISCMPSGRPKPKQNAPSASRAHKRTDNGTRKAERMENFHPNQTPMHSQMVPPTQPPPPYQKMPIYSNNHGYFVQPMHPYYSHLVPIQIQMDYNQMMAGPSTSATQPPPQHVQVHANDLDYDEMEMQEFSLQPETGSLFSCYEFQNETNPGEMPEDLTQVLLNQSDLLN